YAADTNRLESGESEEFVPDSPGTSGTKGYTWDVKEPKEPRVNEISPCVIGRKRDREARNQADRRNLSQDGSGHPGQKYAMEREDPEKPPWTNQQCDACHKGEG
ncbi:hypothetical protein KI387_013158, partial [Taxus chinensis]